MIELCMTYEGFARKPSDNRQWKDWTDALGNPVSEYMYQSMTIVNNPIRISAFDLATKITQGYAWVGATFSKDRKGKRRRRLTNWRSQQVIAADLDKGDITPDQAYDMAYHEGWEPAIIHHTFSSTEECPKLRVIFFLEDPVFDVDLVKSMWVKVGKIYNADLSASDIIKIYQGGVSDCITHFSETYMDPEDFGELPEIRSSEIDGIDLGSTHNLSGNQDELFKSLPKWWQTVMKSLLVDVRRILYEPHKRHRIGNTYVNTRYMALFTAGRLLGQCEHFYINWAKNYIMVLCSTIPTWLEWDRDAEQFDTILTNGLIWGRHNSKDYASKYQTFLQRIENEQISTNEKSDK